MPDHTWRHRHVNVENKKRAQRGEKPYPKYKKKGWDQKSQDDGSWKPSDVDYEQIEKDLNKEGQLTWPKPKIHPDDVAPNLEKNNNWKAEDALKIITNVIKAVPALAAPLLQQTLQISQLHNDNKAGNVDEVWKIRNHPNYKSLPSNEQWLKNLEKARGMVQTADLRNLKKDLPPTGGKFGNIINQQAESYRGIDNDKLIELQRIAAPLLIKNI